MRKKKVHIGQIKSCTEQTLNWWLSYTTAQPIHFDLAILGLFVLQYLGITHFLNIPNHS